MLEENIFRGYGVEVELKDKEAFLKIAETLTRIGIGNTKTQELFQSCHILHKRGRYAILHFKELFALDGKQSTLSNEDVLRRNAVVKLLEEWKLLTINNPMQVEHSSLSNLKILSYEDKKNWRLVKKYAIGVKKKYYKSA